jgi:hypothetical protein
MKSCGNIKPEKLHLVMKKIKTYFILALVSLGTLLSGQAFQAEYITTGYHHTSGRVERFFNRLADRSEPMDGKGYGEPVFYMSYVVDRNNIVHENELSVEDWMTSPFDWALQENELVVEPWMEAPFESGLREPKLAVESWMTRPFELDGDIRIESWMTRPF